jgi:malonate transporter
VLGVLIGFSIIVFVIAVGYLVARLGILGPDAGFVLNRAAFFVFLPALIFTVLASAKVTQLFSSLLLVSLIAALAAFALYVVIARLAWHRSVADVVIGALASGYVNANNIGLPVAVYILGSARYSAPVVLIQLLLFAPVALAILDIVTSGSVSVRRILLTPLTNPIIIASILGVIVSLIHLRLPAPVLEPFDLLAGASVPAVLLAFGMSLRGQKVLEAGTSRKDVVAAASLKLLLMPLLAWIVGAFLFRLSGHDLFAVVALAALPTAQNVYNYAQRYSTGQTLARDAVLVTTVLSIPALLVIALLLG